MKAPAKTQTIISVRIIRFFVRLLRYRLDRRRDPGFTARFFVSIVESEAKNLRRQLRQRNGSRRPRNQRKTSVLRLLRESRTSALPQTGQVIMKDRPEFQLIV